MQYKRALLKAFTLIELLVVVAIIALLISILLPSLTQAKAMAKSVICGSHHKSSYTAWVMYSNDFNGKWMATWDREEYPWSSHSTLQIPLTMWYYTQGISLPGPAFSNSVGWYNPYSKAYGNFNIYIDPTTPEENPNYHCPVCVDSASIENRWDPITSLSVFTPEIINSAGVWDYDSDYYPKPDLFTHHGSTGLLMCLSGIFIEGMTNAWCHFEGYPTDPHSGKSNYTFSDGHVEKLSLDEVDMTMWRPNLKRGQN